LEKRMTIENRKLVKHIIAIFALLDNLSHCRMIEKASALVSKSLSEQRTKDILNIDLGVQVKVGQPNAKRKTVTICVSWQRIEKPTLQMRYDTGMPSEEITTIIGRKCLQDTFSKSHLKGPIEGAEKKILILELNIQRNWMTMNITPIRMMGDPHRHQTSVGVHDEVGTLRVRLKHSPRRATARKRVTTMTKESVTTRPIRETTTIICVPLRIGGIATRPTKANRRRRKMTTMIIGYATIMRMSLDRSTS
jgi:hypothetical protein